MDELTNEEKIKEAYHLYDELQKAKKEIFKLKLLQYINDHKEGFTIYINNYKIHEIKPDETLRYAVAITNNNTPKLVNDLINSIDENFKGYIGGWMDSDKTFYLDKVIIERILNYAIMRAKLNNQKAIYDLYLDEEIKINHFIN